jgi:hypothetical protein
LHLKDSAGPAWVSPPEEEEPNDLFLPSLA